MIFRFAAGLAVPLIAVTATAQSSATKPVASGSQSWSVRFSNAVMARNPEVHTRWDYTAGLVLLAIDRVASARNDASMRSYVKRNMDRFVQPDGSITGYKLDEFNLDQIAQGRLLFPLLSRTNDSRYRKAAQHLREQLSKHPRTSEGGFWHKQVYPEQMWLDGLYMAEPFYAQYARTFNEPSAFDDVTKQFLLPRRAKLPRLLHRIRNGNVNFAGQRARTRLREVKSDDVGGTFMLKELPIHLGHFLFTDQVKTQFILLKRKFFVEQMTHYLAEKQRIQSPRALTVSKRERGTHPANLCRVSLIADAPRKPR